MKPSARTPSLSLICVSLVLGVLGASCSVSDDPDTAIDSTAGAVETTDGATETTVASEPSTSTSSSSSTTEASEPETALTPAYFWAIDQLSLDLVLVDVGTGEISQRLLGWGARLGDPEPEGGLQALSDLSPAGDVVWVEDCCEPAVGNVYRVDVGATTPVPQSEVSIDGVGPIVSPNRAQVAVQVLDIGVAIHDATDGAMLVEPSSVDRVAAVPADAAGFAPARPLGWLDDTTVAVGVSSDTATSITLVSLANPSLPAAVGPTIEIDGPVVAASLRADGALVSFVSADGAAASSGRVHDPDTGDELAVFELPDGTVDIDYDPSGTFLLASTTDGVVFRVGGGDTVEIAEGYLQAQWAPDAAPTPVSGPLDLATFESGQASDVGIDTPGGCSFYRNGAPGSTVFFSGLDGAFAVIDGEEVVFQTDQPDDGPFTADGYVASFENLSDRVPSSIESNERSTTLVVTDADGGAETRIDGIVWCGV